MLEDLSHMEFFDRFHVASAEQARTVIRAIARLHGHYWDKHDQPPLAGLYQFSSLKNRVLLHLAYLLSGNIVFGADNPDEMSVIDWQVCGVGCGMEDVATLAGKMKESA